jgi:hypothetical protein
VAQKVDTMVVGIAVGVDDIVVVEVDTVVGGDIVVVVVHGIVVAG